MERWILLVFAAPVIGWLGFMSWLYGVPEWLW